MAHLVAETVARHGGLHVAVNNAGTIGVPGLLADLSEDAWAGVLSTNLTGVWLCIKHQIAHMRSQGGGCIVNLASSIGAHLTLPGMGAYAATKAAVNALTRTAAKEYIGAGIRINAVSPGPVDTPMSRFPGETDQDRDARLAQVLPIRRPATTDEIAAAVVWLNRAAVVGHDLVIDYAGTPDRRHPAWPPRRNFGDVGLTRARDPSFAKVRAGAARAGAGRRGRGVAGSGTRGGDADLTGCRRRPRRRRPRAVGAASAVPHRRRRTRARVPPPPPRHRPPP